METLSDLVTTFIVNSIWQASALLLIASGCAYLMRSASARHKHLLWVAVLVLSVVLPILSFCNNGNNFYFGFRLPLANNQSHIANGGSSDQQTSEYELLSQSNEQSTSLNLSVIYSTITVLYFSFLLYRFASLLVLWRRTIRLRHSARNEKLSPFITAVAKRCYASLEIKSVPILFSAETFAPLTLGSQKPLIILPESFLDITSEETLTAAIGHESAHIRRRDYGLNLVCEFLSLLVSFHPAVKVIKRKIDQTREMACDELVSENLLRPLDYARSLVRIAGFISPASQNAFTLGVFNADILERRIMKLIEKSRGEKSRTGKIKFLFVSALLGAVAITIPAFSFALPTNQMLETKSEKRESNNKDEEKVYKVEMYSGGERVASVTLIEHSPGRTTYGYVLRTIPKNQIATTPEGEKVYALQILSRLQKDTVKLEIIALLEDPETISNEHPLDKLTKRSIGTYNISEGEQITLSEMTEFGLQPLEIRVTFGDKTKPTDKDRQTITVIRSAQSNKKDSKAPADKESSSTAKADGAQRHRVLSKPIPQSTEVGNDADSKTISGGVLNGKAASLPLPEYPPAAKAVTASGAVNVQVTIDEEGNIISAQTISGHPLLRQSAEKAAKEAKFAPTFLNGQPIKVSGVLVYNFAP